MEQWRRERPDLDPSPMGIIGRLHRLADALHTELRPTKKQAPPPSALPQKPWKEWVNQPPDWPNAAGPDTSVFAMPVIPTAGVRTRK